MNSSPDFEIKIIRQHWIKDDNKYDYEDICSHGEVYIRIGAEVLSDKSSGSWTLSATGLYLLRSLEQDCDLNEFSNQLLPCCGHFLIPDEEGNDYVTILGCNIGIDWKISHSDKSVIFKSEKGTVGEVSRGEYKNIVLNFVSEIEDFYGDPARKLLPDDLFDRNGFNQFWREWSHLKNKHV